jgi:HEAT repeat protein
MKKNAELSNKISELVQALAAGDAVVREQSRTELVQLGGPDVTRELVTALIDPRRQIRWEAAKALQEIADPVSAPALMHAMDDEDEDVRWVAAEGLVALGKVGLMTVLSGLIKRAGSIDFCKSAHHVLNKMKAYEGRVAPVLEALEQLEPAVGSPPAAYRALLTLNDVPAA